MRSANRIVHTRGKPAQPQVVGKAPVRLPDRAYLWRNAFALTLTVGLGRFHASFGVAAAVAWKAALRTDKLWMRWRQTLGI